MTSYYVKYYIINYTRNFSSMHAYTCMISHYQNMHIYIYIPPILYIPPVGIYICTFYD